MRRPLLLVLSLLAILVPTGILGATGAVSAAAATTGSGYWMLSSDGHVYAFGDAKTLAGKALGSAPAVDLEPTAAGDGYWILDQRGRVHTSGTAGYLGDLRPADLDGGETATSLSATPAGGGYWIFTSRGRAVAFGDAVHHGDMAATTLNGPVLDSIPTPSGGGYYMVASDGGIFSFGDATFYGSMGGTKLNAPVQSLVPDGDGVGYWLVASDGGIFSFEAPFKGSMGATPLNKPVTGMVRYGDGYLMVGEDGGIFNFSDLPFSGSLGDRPPAHPIVSVGAFDVPSVETASDAPGSPGNAGGIESPSTTTTTVNPSTTTTTTTAPPSPPVDDSMLPAGMPSETPDELFPCDTSSRIAKVWLKLDGQTSSPWAAFNPCDRPLLLAWSFDDEGASGDEGAVVAPGAHFNEPHGPVADHGGARLTNSLVQCWEEGPLPVMLRGADEWARPGCEPDDSDPTFSGLPPGEPTHVLPCGDGSGASALAWEHTEADGFETWGASNPCHDRWLLFSRSGESVSDPYGATLSVAPGTQFHRRIGGMEGHIDRPEGQTPQLSSKPDYETNGCGAGDSLYEMWPEDGGEPRYVGSCPDAGDLGWYQEVPDDYEGPECFRRVADVIGTAGDDVLTPADTNGDGDYVVAGMGGNDRFENLGLDSSSPREVFFCGGAGNDTAHGWALLVDGGAGSDSLHMYDCYLGGTRTAWRYVEDVSHNAYQCG